MRDILLVGPIFFMRSGSKAKKKIAPATLATWSSAPTTNGRRGAYEGNADGRVDQVEAKTSHHQGSPDFVDCLDGHDDRVHIDTHEITCFRSTHFASSLGSDD